MFSNNNITAIIIEDELASQEYITDLLEAKFPEIKVISIEDTVPSAISAIDNYSPDIVFLDVEIKAGTGFDVLAGVKNSACHVIFTTAYNKFAIDAFQYNTVDYLLKPLESEKVIAAIQRCMQKITLRQPGKELVQLLQYLKQPTWQQRLPVGTMYGMEFIDIEEILFVEAEGNYSKLKLRSGRSLMMTKKIKDVTEQLQESLFVRIHNSYLVNTRYIKKYHKGRGGHIILDDGSSLPVSPARKEDFLKIFNQKL